MDNTSVGKIMKHILIVIFSITTYLYCQSFRITGHVYDVETGLPLKSANVVSGNIGTITDEFGQFELILPKPSKFEVHLIGYEMQTLDYSTDPIIVYLNSKLLSGNPIEVSANRIIPGITPVAHSHLTIDEIKNQYYVEDVPMVLSTEPGIHSYSESGNGTGYSYVSIRGFDQSRIAVMLDNVPLNDNESHQVYWVDHADILSNASVVEIQRGIGNSLYGSTAFGGSINVETKIANPTEQIKFSSVIGTYSTFKGRLQYLSGPRFGDNLSLALRLSSIISDGYRDNSDSKQTAFSLGVEHQFGKINNKFRTLIGKEVSTLQWDGITKNMLMDRQLRTKKLDWTIPFIDDFLQQIYSLNTEVPLKDNLFFRNVAYLVRGSGFYEVNRFGEDYFSYNLDIENKYSDEQEQNLQTDFLRRKWIKNIYYGVVPSITYKIDNIRADFGLESRFYSGLHFGEVMNVTGLELQKILPKNYRYYEYTGNKNSISAFAHLLYSFQKKLHLIGDIQLQRHNWTLDQKQIGHAAGHDLSAKWQFINPRFGFSYDLDKNISIFTNYGTAEKEPSDAQIIEADDVWSEPKEAAVEKIFDKEMGINIKQNIDNLKFNFKLNYYRIDYLNEILSNIYDFAEGEFDINSADKTRHEGLELETGWEISPQLTINFNGAISLNHFASGESKGKTLTNTPNRLANWSIIYTPTKQLNFNLQGKYVGQQFIDNKNTSAIKIDPYFLINAGCSYTLGNLTFSARINNLFDELYATYGYFYHEGYYWPGATRNFNFAIDLKL